MHQLEGIIPDFRIVLKSFASNSLYSVGLNLINSFIILSIPLDLLFFSLLISLLISSGENSLFRTSFPFSEMSFTSK